jgi:hypothetical protein
VHEQPAPGAREARGNGFRTAAGHDPEVLRHVPQHEHSPRHRRVSGKQASGVKQRDRAPHPPSFL